MQPIMIATALSELILVGIEMNKAHASEGFDEDEHERDGVVEQIRVAAKKEIGLRSMPR